MCRCLYQEHVDIRLHAVCTFSRSAFPPPPPPPPPVLCVLLHHVLQMKSLCTGSLQLCDCFFPIPTSPLRDFTRSLGPLAVSSGICCWVPRAESAEHWDCSNTFVYVELVISHEKQKEDRISLFASYETLDLSLFFHV